MYNNVGNKIMGLAQVLCWLGIIASIAMGVLLITIPDAMVLDFTYRMRLRLPFSVTEVPVIAGIVVMVVGSLISWLSSWLLFGFGQMVRDAHIIANNASSPMRLRPLTALTADRPAPAPLAATPPPAPAPAAPAAPAAAPAPEVAGVAPLAQPAPAASPAPDAVPLLTKAKAKGNAREILAMLEEELANDTDEESLDLLLAVRRAAFQERTQGNWKAEALEALRRFYSAGNGA